MKHMKLPDRHKIGFAIAHNSSCEQVADDLGRSQSGIREELKNHRISSSKRYGCSNRLCAHFDECEQIIYGATTQRLRKMTPRCFESCPHFREAVCMRLMKFPFVCNGCEHEYNCPLMKKFYIPEAAQVAYETLRSNSRKGVHADEKMIKEMDEVLSPSVRKGQSISAVINGNPDKFKMPGKEGKYFGVSTVYGWLENRLFSARSSDLPFAGRRKKTHHKRSETKTNARCRVGRTIKEMWEWLKLHTDVIPCELDTVIGSISGKVLFTMIFPKSSLALGFLRDAKTSQTCTRIFNMLWEKAGSELFRKLFAAILTDNGAEFSDPEMVENYRSDPEHNPTKLVSRGIRVWYTDAYCSSQKPHIENFHILLRRILEKGSSFNMLDQSGVNCVFSHLNSYPRDSKNGNVPYDLFIEEFGEEGKSFLDKIGIVRVPADKVTLHPFLLGQKYQREADRAVLRKHGVIKPKKSTDMK